MEHPSTRRDRQPSGNSESQDGNEPVVRPGYHYGPYGRVMVPGQMVQLMPPPPPVLEERHAAKQPTEGGETSASATTATDSGGVEAIPEAFLAQRELPFLEQNAVSKLQSKLSSGDAVGLGRITALRREYELSLRQQQQELLQTVELSLQAKKSYVNRLSEGEAMLDSVRSGFKKIVALCNDNRKVLPDYEHIHRVWCVQENVSKTIRLRKWFSMIPKRAVELMRTLQYYDSSVVEVYKGLRQLVHLKNGLLDAGVDNFGLIRQDYCTALMACNWDPTILSHWQIIYGQLPTWGDLISQPCNQPSKGSSGKRGVTCPVGSHWASRLFPSSIAQYRYELCLSLHVLQILVDFVEDRLYENIRDCTYLGQRDPTTLVRTLQVVKMEDDSDFKVFDPILPPFFRLQPYVYYDRGRRKALPDRSVVKAGIASANAACVPFTLVRRQLRSAMTLVRRESSTTTTTQKGPGGGLKCDQENCPFASLSSVESKSRRWDPDQVMSADVAKAILFNEDPKQNMHDPVVRQEGTLAPNSAALRERQIRAQAKTRAVTRLHVAQVLMLEFNRCLALQTAALRETKRAPVSTRAERRKSHMVTVNDKVQQPASSLDMHKKARGILQVDMGDYEDASDSSDSDEWGAEVGLTGGRRGTVMGNAAGVTPQASPSAGKPVCSEQTDSKGGKVSFASVTSLTESVDAFGLPDDLDPERFLETTATRPHWQALYNFLEGKSFKGTSRELLLWGRRFMIAPPPEVPSWRGVDLPEDPNDVAAEEGKETEGSLRQRKVHEETAETFDRLLRRISKKGGRAQGDLPNCFTLPLDAFMALRSSGYNDGGHQQSGGSSVRGLDWLQQPWKSGQRYSRYLYHSCVPYRVGWDFGGGGAVSSAGSRVYQAARLSLLYSLLLTEPLPTNPRVRKGLRGPKSMQTRASDELAAEISRFFEGLHCREQLAKSGAPLPTGSLSEQKLKDEQVRMRKILQEVLAQLRDSVYELYDVERFVSPCFPSSFDILNLYQEHYRSRVRSTVYSYVKMRHLLSKDSLVAICNFVSWLLYHGDTLLDLQVEWHEENVRGLMQHFLQSVLSQLLILSQNFIKMDEMAGVTHRRSLVKMKTDVSGNYTLIEDQKGFLFSESPGKIVSSLIAQLDLCIKNYRMKGISLAHVGHSFTLAIQQYVSQLRECVRKSVIIPDYAYIHPASDKTKYYAGGRVFWYSVRNIDIDKDYSSNWYNPLTATTELPAPVDAVEAGFSAERGEMQYPKSGRVPGSMLLRAPSHTINHKVYGTCVLPEVFYDRFLQAICYFGKLPESVRPAQRRWRALSQVVNKRKSILGKLVSSKTTESKKQSADQTQAGLIGGWVRSASDEYIFRSAMAAAGSIIFGWSAAQLGAVTGDTVSLFCRSDWSVSRSRRHHHQRFSTIGGSPAGFRQRTVSSAVVQHQPPANVRPIPEEEMSNVMDTYPNYSKLASTHSGASRSDGGSSGGDERKSRSGSQPESGSDGNRPLSGGAAGPPVNWDALYRRHISRRNETGVWVEARPTASSAGLRSADKTSYGYNLEERRIFTPRKPNPLFAEIVSESDQRSRDGCRVVGTSAQETGIFFGDLPGVIDVMRACQMQPEGPSSGDDEKFPSIAVRPSSHEKKVYVHLTAPNQKADPSMPLFANVDESFLCALLNNCALLEEQVKALSKRILTIMQSQHESAERALHERRRLHRQRQREKARDSRQKMSSMRERAMTGAGLRVEDEFEDEASLSSDDGLAGSSEPSGAKKAPADDEYVPTPPPFAKSIRLCFGRCALQFVGLAHDLINSLVHVVVGSCRDALVGGNLGLPSSPGQQAEGGLYAHAWMHDKGLVAGPSMDEMPELVVNSSSSTTGQTSSKIDGKPTSFVGKALLTTIKDYLGDFQKHLSRSTHFFKLLQTLVRQLVREYLVVFVIRGGQVCKGKSKSSNALYLDRAFFKRLTAERDMLLHFFGKFSPMLRTGSWLKNELNGLRTLTKLCKWVSRYCTGVLGGTCDPKGVGMDLSYTSNQGRGSDARPRMSSTVELGTNGDFDGRMYEAGSTHQLGADLREISSRLGYHLTRSLLYVVCKCPREVPMVKMNQRGKERAAQLYGTIEMGDGFEQHNLHADAVRDIMHFFDAAHVPARATEDSTVSSTGASGLRGEGASGGREHFLLQDLNPSAVFRSAEADDDDILYEQEVDQVLAEAGVEEEKNAASAFGSLEAAEVEDVVTMSFDDWLA